MHRYFVEHPKAADRSLILSSLLSDIFGLFLIGAAIFGPTFALFLGILIVFSLRQVCQAFCTLPPPGIIWRDPGFPALLVTYGVSNDFFFPDTPRWSRSGQSRSATSRRGGSGCSRY